MSQIIVIHNDISQVIYDDEEIVRLIYYDEEETDQRAVFIRDGNCISHLDSGDISSELKKLDLSDFIYDELTTIPLSIYIKLHLTQKIGISIKNTRDHPVCIVCFEKNSYTKFERIISKIKNADPSFIYEPCNSIDVFNRFLNITDLKEVLKIGKASFDHEWLIHETTYLRHLYDAYKNYGKIGEFLSESLWIASNQIKTVLQLLMAFPAPDFGLFLCKAKNHPNIDLSSDNINSIHDVLDTYRLSDEVASDFIIFCISKNISCNVIVTESLWLDQRMCMAFLRKNFISMVGIHFVKRKNPDVIDPIYIELCDKYEFSNTNMQKFVSKTKRDVDLLKANVRFRAKHIITFFSRSCDIINYALPMFDYFRIRLEDDNCSIYDAIVQVKANRALIMFLVQIEATRQDKGKHHNVLCNFDLLCCISEYLGVSNHYRNLLLEGRKNQFRSILRDN